MNKLCCALVVLSLVGSTHAGVVLFDPPEVAFDPADPERIYEFTVTVANYPGGAVMMQGVDIVFNSNVMELLEFAYSPEFEAASAFPTPPFRICNIGFCFDYAGGFLTTPLAFPVIVGVLRALFREQPIDIRPARVRDLGRLEL